MEKTSPELLTVKKAANIIGVEYRQLLEAVNSNIIPHYQVNNSRRLVRISEVLTAMKVNGGRHD